MNDGFIKVAAITPEISVADPQKNAKVICDDILKATALGAKVIVFPELPHRLHVRRFVLSRRTA